MFDNSKEGKVGGTPEFTRRDFLKLIYCLGCLFLGGKFYQLLIFIINLSRGTSELTLTPSPSPTSSETSPVDNPDDLSLSELKNGEMLVFDVEPLSQQDSRWAAINLGNNPPDLGYTIGSAGCLITSLSMYLRATGQLNKTPDIVNKELTQDGGYKPGSGNFDFEKGPSVLKLNQTAVSEEYSDKPVEEEGLNFVRKQIFEGKPLLALVDANLNTLRNEEHWVLVIGVGKNNGGEWLYTYVDPWDGQVYTVNEEIFARKGILFFAYDKKLIPQIKSINEIQTVGPQQFPTGIPPSADTDYSQIAFNQNAKLNGNFPDAINQWAPYIDYFAKRYGLPPELVASVVYIESKGEENAYSKSGAVGLMQVMPRDGIAGGFMCPNGPCFADRPTTEQLKNHFFNLDYGCWYLKMKIKENEGRIPEGLIFYGGNKYYSDKVYEIWKQFSPDTVINTLSEESLKPLVTHSIIEGKQFNLPPTEKKINYFSGADLYQIEKGVYLAVYDLSKLTVEIATSNKFTSFAALSRDSLSSFAGTHYQQGLLQFPLKVNGRIIPNKTSSNNPSDDLRMLEIFSDHAEVRKLNQERFNNSPASTIITANDIDDNREYRHYRPRTIAAVDEKGRLLILVFKSANRKEVEKVLQALNIDPQRVLNLGGGEQAGLIFNGQTYLSSNKNVTHVVGVKPRNP